MLQRHWTRLSELTGHSFQVDSESFSLRNIMEAPLLKYKEDIEVLMLTTPNVFTPDVVAVDWKANDATVCFLNSVTFTSSQIKI